MLERLLVCCEAKTSSFLTCMDVTNKCILFSIQKLEEETDELRHNRVDRSLSQAIQQARIAKKLSQKQLATQMSEKPQVVAEYESGKAIPSPAILSKMER